MTTDGTEVDPYGRPTEAARAYLQMTRQDPSARVRKQPGLSGSAPTYAIWGTRKGRAFRLSLDMPDEATAWINANSQLAPTAQKGDGTATPGTANDL
jgi:hypothetical protein